MAYIFPVNPYDGQLYPVPAVQGALQYQWNASLQVWLIYSPLGVVSVTGILPIFVQGDTSSPIISINAATINTAGSMSAADKAKLDGIPANAGTGTVTRVASGPGLVGGPITGSGTLSVRPATTTVLGGVIVGENLTVDGNGVISIPTASLGVKSINVGPGLVGAPNPITNVGTISAALANRLSPGVVRVGSGIAVAPDGTISVDGALAKAAILAYASVSVANASSPPVFTVLESYNISAITWAGTVEYPRVRITYQNSLANNSYGLLSGALCQQTGFPPGAGSYPQRSQSIDFSSKETSYCEIQLCTRSVANVTTNYSNVTIWNDWGNTTSTAGGGPAGIAQFDIAIIDTPVF
jgi:hypothetical protein